jgi:DNA-binding phage protein
VTTDDLMAWLGPAGSELTPEQMELVADAARDINTRYPDPDEQPDREAALSATVQYLLGETSPEEAARELAQARQREHEAFVTALQVAVMAHRVGGIRKATAARTSGIDRMGLLKALGER